MMRVPVVMTAVMQTEGVGEDEITKRARACQMKSKKIFS
jgi:hypothetical protein